MWSEPISDLKLDPPALLTEESSIQECISHMQDKREPFLLLCDSEGQLSGIFTERDVMNSCVDTRLSLDTKVSAVMNRRVLTTKLECTIREAVNDMGAYRVSQLPVVEKNEVVGVVTVEKLLERLTEAFPDDLLNLPPHATVPSRQTGG